MKPIDKVNIGYNKTNDEYIGYLEEKNKLLKDQKNSRQYQEKKKIEEREKGFNVFISGANEDRIIEQRRKEVLKEGQQRAQSNQDPGSKGQRRQWRNPSGNDRDASQEEESETRAHPKYHNPFDLHSYDSKPSTSSKPGKSHLGGQSPPKIRKRWGQAQEFGKAGQPMKVFSKNEGEEEDEYSDEFEEQHDQDSDQEEIKNEYEGFQPTKEKQEANEIEQFLRTGTREELNELRMSLSNFRNFKNHQQQKEAPAQKDDDYIEEEFEEEIPEVSEGDSDDERKQYEEAKRIQQQQATVQTSRVAKPGGKIRPISATFNLAQQKTVQSTRNADTGSQYVANMYNPPPTLQQKSINTQSTQQFQPIVQETPQQPKDSMKKPINTNPFKRPFSQNVPKRQEVASVAQSQNKTSESAFQDQPKGLSILMQRLENLNDNQIEHLLDVLDNLECSDVFGAVTNVQSSYVTPGEPQQEQKLDLKFLSPPKKQEEQKPQKVTSFDKTRNELVIRVLNTYGYPHCCGLTEIELFDQNSKKISLLPASIFSRNMGQGPKVSLEKLLNGVKLTNDDRQMWIGHLPQPPQHLEILIYYNKDVTLGALKIWNYNKSIVNSTKGAKDIQVLINEDMVWEGQLLSGKGQTDIDYGTAIILQEGVKIPPAIQPKASVIDQAVYEEEEEEEQKSTDVKQSQGGQEMPEELRKYRSEVNMKKRPDSTPFWLNQNQAASKPNLSSKQPERIGQSQQSQRKPENKPGQETFNLLDKYSNKESTSIGDTSSNQSLEQKGNYTSVPNQRSSQFRDQPVASGIKPNAGLGGPAQPIKSKPFEISQQNKQWTQPFSVQQREETSQAIANAVNKVNQVVNSQPSHRAGNKRNAKMVEESLDSLDFFKVTNLGRLHNDQEKSDKQVEQTDSKRGKWRSSPAKGLQDSQMSGGKHKNAHVVVKNPFPESKQTPGTQRKQGVKFGEDDILDQWMNHGAQVSKVKTSRDPEPIQSFQSKQPKFQDNILSQSPPKYEPKSQVQSSLPPPSKTAPETFEDKLKQFNEPFIIPNLPSGAKLEFNILSTWGDMNYVGLTGIEIFDIEGNQLKIEEANISACPPDVNILPGYGSDPRTIDKLIDDHLFTNDDLHVWLTPFTAGDDHTITIDLGRKHQLSMVRIWNYNKSRIHSYRGARLITCQLDGKVVFKGEIQKAPGNLNNPEDCCEIILFTDNNAILQRIDTGDWLNHKQIVSDMEDTQRIMMQEVPNYLEDRPMTATKKFNTAEIQDLQRHLKQQKPQSLFDERPTTSAIITGDQEERKLNQYAQQPSYQARDAQLSRKQDTTVRGRVIEMDILESWGDLFYVGLNGLEVLDERGMPIPIQLSMVDANPRDMNSIPGHGSDHRTLDKLFNKVNNTIDDHNMWLIPYNKGEHHSLKIDFGRQMTISAVKFYNYNKNEEDTLRGVKQISITLDQKYLTPKKGITLRKAPGLVHSLFDMGQIINLPYKQGWTTDSIVPLQRKFEQIGLFQEYEALNLPMGFMFKFNLYSTHGDFYYIGLNGIELFDQNGQIITPDHIFAEPQGVHTVQGMEGDLRKVGNIINGKNETFDEMNMWLSPFKNTRSYAAAGGKENTLESRIPNYVFLSFDQPKAISGIRIWNYSKTSSRGVNEFELLIDDKQAYRGFVKQAPEKQEWEKAFNKDFSTTVIFTSDVKIVEKFKNNVNYDPLKQQTVGLVNEKKVVSKNVQLRPNEQHVFNEMQRPQTMVRRQ